MEETQSRYPRRYDREFKENAVALVESGNDQTQVGTMDGESCSQREIRRLRQENDYLRRQREILKKALGLTRLRLAPTGLT